MNLDSVMVFSVDIHALLNLPILLTWLYVLNCPLTGALGSKWFNHVSLAHFQLKHFFQKMNFPSTSIQKDEIANNPHCS